jgi:hypothetical protein
MYIKEKYAFNFIINFCLVLTVITYYVPISSRIQGTDLPYYWAQNKREYPLTAKTQHIRPRQKLNINKLYVYIYINPSNYFSVVSVYSLQFIINNLIF